MTARKMRAATLYLDADFAFQIPGAPSYGVTIDGRVRRLSTGKWLAPVEAQRGGYLQVSLWHDGKAKIRYVHQLVALTFIGPRPSPKHDAAHGDGNKKNNHYLNIRWATRSENERDKVAHGTSNRGERNGGAKITDAQAAEIKMIHQSAPRSSGDKRARKGVLTQLAARYGVTPGAITLIVSGRRRN